MDFKVLISKISLVLLGGLFNFCTYSPDEDFFKKIEEIDPTTFNISLDSYNPEDTIYIDGPVEFNFNIKSGKGNIRSVTMYINDDVLNRTSNSSGSFSFNPSTGIYKLKIEFISSSGTGSLADQAGAEEVQVWNQWIIKAYVETPPEKPQMTSTIENGFAVVHWTPYTRTKFDSYRIEAGGQVVYITDPSVNFWVDSTFTGHFSKYYYLVTKNQAGTATSAITLSGNTAFSFDAEYNPEDSSISVDIPKPIYYGPLNSYSILENNVEIARLSDLNELKYFYKTNNVGVNYYTDIWVRYNPNPPASKSTTSGKTLLTSSTKRLSRNITNAAFNEDFNSIIGYGGSSNRVYFLNPETLSIDDSISISSQSQFFVPYKGTYAYYYSAGASELRQLNLSTHEEIKVGNRPARSVSYTQLYTYYVQVMWMDNRYRYGSYVVDVTSNEFITKLEGTSAFSPHYVSEDGQFVRLNTNDFYRVSNKQVAPLGTLAYTGFWIGFRKDFCEEILTYLNNTVYIYDTNVLTLKRTVDGPSGSYFHSYDIASKCLIFNHPAEKKIYSINIDTGVQHEVKANLSDFSVINGFILVNSRDYYKFY